MKQNNRIGFLISVLLIGIMAASAELTGRQEILFPEMAALLTGSFLMEKRPWNVPHGAGVLEMTFCALAGVQISRNEILPLYIKMLAAAAVVLILFVISGIEMTPAISACALPVLLQKSDFIYVAAVLIMALVCDAGNLWMERTSRMETRAFQRGQRNWRHLYLELPAYALVLSVPMLTGLHFMTAPPLIVAFVTLCGPNVLSKQRPLPVILLFFVEGCIGFAFRMLSELSGITPIVCLTVSAVAAWLVMIWSRHPFPPASAIALLPFLLPSEGLWIYPIEILAGISLYYLAAWLLSKISVKEKIRKNCI